MNFFKPDSFKNDPYGYATNQISHCALSMFLVYSLNAYVLVALFWVAWELYHFYVSRDVQDFFEDLFFELSGIVVYFIPWWAFVVAAALGITTWMRIR